jgi:choline dehydrogenase-like flavoprotein
VPGALLARVVGGCGVHNAMLYVRALPSNIDAWNVSSWRWEHIYAQYLAAEDWRGAATGSDWKHHASGGANEPDNAAARIAVSPPMFHDILGNYFVQATNNHLDRSPFFAKSLVR